MHKIACDWGVIPPALIKNKKIIRDYIRNIKDGELIWRHLQAEVYGPRINEAVISNGLVKFLIYCSDNNIDTCIVSHKTTYSNLEGSKVNLRDSALKWLTINGFFLNRKWGIDSSKIFFEDTIEKKISKIKNIGVTHFIDDLEEIFLNPLFPEEVIKILYSKEKCNENIKVFSDWYDIKKYISNE